jgi:hypothetical protein
MIPQRWMRRLRKLALLPLLFLGSGVCYAASLCYPQPWFPYSAHLGQVTIHSDRPLPPAIFPILTAVNRRLAASAIYDPALSHQVFLCNDRWRFTFFANVNHQAGGVNYWWLNQNSFLRPIHVETNRLIAPSGREVPGDRTLVYFITHEVTHGLTAAKIGREGYWRLPIWIREGYADYVGKASLDLPQALAKFKQNAREMNPTLSGLYCRYHLLVAYLLDIKHVPAQRLLEGQWDQRRVEDEVARLAPPAPSE